MEAACISITEEDPPNVYRASCAEIESASKATTPAHGLSQKIGYRKSAAAESTCAQDLLKSETDAWNARSLQHGLRESTRAGAMPSDRANKMIITAISLLIR